MRTKVICSLLSYGDKKKKSRLNWSLCLVFVHWREGLTICLWLAIIYIDQADVELTDTHLPVPPKHWDERLQIFFCLFVWDRDSTIPDCPLVSK